MRVVPPAGRAVAALAVVLALLPVTGASARESVSLEQAADELRAPQAELDPIDRERSRGTSFLRLQQEVDGVPVLGAEAVVSEAGGKAGDLVVDDTRRDVSAPPEPDLSRADALDRAREATDARRLRAPAEAELSIRPDAGGGTLVWRVLLPVEDPFADLEVLVDARSGEVLSIENLIQRAEGQGKVFDPNAVVARGTYEDPRLVDNGDADNELLTSLLTGVTLPRLADRTDGQLCLTGDWAEARVQTQSGGTGEVCAPGGDFTVMPPPGEPPPPPDEPPPPDPLTRSDDEFEPVMAYFHVDRAQKYIQDLGFTNVNARRTPIIANGDCGGSNPDNSCYSRFSDTITLGLGFVDDGEDADVIVHEYGHAIQDNQVPFFGGAGDTPAMGEGFGDYFAAVMSSEGSETPRDQFDPCMFEWDTWGSASPAPCLRRTDGNQKLEDVEGVTGCGTHCVGQVWSGALWELRDELGEEPGDERSVMDLLVLHSHFYLTSSASFDDAARALLAADGWIYGGAHRDELRAELTQRGLLDPNVPRTLSIKYSNKSEGFKGTLGAERPACVPDQLVEIYKKVKGPNKLIGQDRTDAAGKYLEPERRRDGRFYAVAPESSADGDTCLEARSLITELD